MGVIIASVYIEDAAKRAELAKFPERRFTISSDFADIASSVKARPGVPARLYTDFSPGAVESYRVRMGTASFVYDHGGEHAGVVEGLEWTAEGEMIVVARINPETEGGRKFLEAEPTRRGVSKEFVPIELRRMDAERDVSMTRWEFVGLASVDTPALPDAINKETALYASDDKLATTSFALMERLYSETRPEAEETDYMTPEQQAAAMALAEKFGLDAQKYALKAIKENLSYDAFVEGLSALVEGYDKADDETDDDDDMNDDEMGKKKKEDAEGTGAEDSSAAQSDSVRIAVHGKRVGMGEMATAYIAEGKSYLEFAEAVIAEKAQTVNPHVDRLSAQVEKFQGQEIFNTTAYIQAVLRPGDRDKERKAAYELDFAKEANKSVGQGVFVIPWDANLKYGRRIRGHRDLLDLANRGIISAEEYKSYAEDLNVSGSGFVTTIVDMARAETALVNESVVMDYIETSTGHQMNETIPIGNTQAVLQGTEEGEKPIDRTPDYNSYSLTPKYFGAAVDVTQLLDIQTLGAGSRMVVMDLINSGAERLDQLVLLGASENNQVVVGIAGHADSHKLVEANIGAVDFDTIRAMEKLVMDAKAPRMANMVSFFNNLTWQALRAKLEVPGARDSTRVIEVSGWADGTTSSGTQPAHRASVIPQAVGAASTHIIMGRFDTVRMPMWGPGIQIVAGNYVTAARQTFEIIIYTDVGIPRGDQFSINRITA